MPFRRWHPRRACVIRDVVGLKRNSEHEDPAADAAGAPPPRHGPLVTALELVVVLPTLVFLAVALVRDPEAITPGVWFFAVSIAVIDLIPVPAWSGLQLSVSFPVLLGAAVLFPPAVAGAIALVGSCDPRELRRQIPVLRAAYNRCQIAISTMAAGWMFHRIATIESPWTRIVPGILLAAVVGYTLNALSVAIYLAAEQHISVGRVLARMHGGAPYEFLFSYLGLGLLGAVVARFYRGEGSWSVVVLLAPLVFARQMYFRSRSLADRLAEQNRVLADQAAKLEQLLEKEHNTVDELRELNRMKNEFVAVVSHELRTPVTALIGYAKTLQQPTFAEDPDLRQEFLERMERQGDRLVRLVENLLTAARIESRQLPVQVSRVRFEDLVRDVVEGLGAEGERVRVDVPSDLPVLHTDRELLVRVLSNLLDNALKYSPDESTCEIGASGDDVAVVFWVQDRGIGIAPEDVPRIFERFYQVDSSSTRTFRGAGLGLSLVQELVQRLGGSITVQSEPGRGSRFTVTLPPRAPDPLGSAPASSVASDGRS
jgi:signal transduction histidine kinase